MLLSCTKLYPLRHSLFIQHPLHCLSRWCSSEEKKHPPVYGVTNVPSGHKASTIYSEYFTGGHYRPRTIEKNGVCSADVMNDNVDVAMGILNRKSREEGFFKIWRSRRHIRSCLKRRESRRDAEYRQFKRQVSERMKWIYRFKARGF